MHIPLSCFLSTSILLSLTILWRIVELTFHRRKLNLKTVLIFFHSTLLLKFYYIYYCKLPFCKACVHPKLGDTMCTSDSKSWPEDILYTKKIQRQSYWLALFAKHLHFLLWIIWIISQYFQTQNEIHFNGVFHVLMRSVPF